METEPKQPVLINMYLKIYHTLEGIPFLRRYLRMIAARYEPVYVGDRYEIAAKTINVMFTMLIADIAAFLLILLTNPSLYSLFTAVYIIYVISTQLLYRSSRRARRYLLSELDIFLNNVRHYYYMTRNVVEAIWEAKENSNRTMRLQSEEVYRVMTAEDADYRRLLYIESSAERYMKLFLSLSMNVCEYGDTGADDKSGYLRNLVAMRGDIKEEYRGIRKQEHSFAGFAITAAAPIMTMSYIADWGMSTLADMQEFYLGIGGSIMRVIILLLSFFCYEAVVRLHEGDTSSGKRHIMLKRLSFTRAFNAVTDYLSKRSYANMVKQQNILKSLCETYSVKTLYMKRILSATAGLLGGIGICLYCSSVSIPVIMGSAISAYVTPLLILYFRKQFVTNRMQEEVLHFQAVIAMQVFTAGVSVISMLETMEEFAQVFRESIRRAINEYSIDDTEALTTLRQAESYLPFTKLIDCFLMVEESGIEKAFEEIVFDMESHREHNRLEAAIMQEDKAKLGMLMAMIPGLTILFGYLLIPFMISALSMFDAYTNSLSEML